MGDIASTEAQAMDLADFVASIPEASSETEEEFTHRLVEQFNELNDWFAETYTDLNAVSTMTSEEFLEVYPTAETQEALQERARAAQSVLFGRLRDLFAEVPAPVAKEALSVANEHFTQLWGTETADMIIMEIRTELGL